jgi:NADPH-dependent glutamate synthase beta subunit-like oxidoreductase
MNIQELHDPASLARLTTRFEESLDRPLLERYLAHKSTPLRGPEESALLIDLAAALSKFLGEVFGVSYELQQLREAAGRDAAIFRVKREFVQRRVFKKGAKDRPHADDFPKLDAQVRALLGDGADDELQVALAIEKGDQLDLFDKWLYALFLQPHRPPWVMLRLPHTLDFQALVPLKRPQPDKPEVLAGHEEHQRKRDGFRLTDPRMSAREVRSEIDYCIYCHEREKDSCSRGFMEKTGHYRKNPLGIPLTGCPLEERISEMHTAAREGDALAALALVCIDNPMLPGTGHRICNDCMKACIYQKQDPVNIPQIETRVLTDIFGIRWGYEIWSLLTRWNPLRFRRQHPRPYSGVNVLVVGMGPAGYTLALHLLNEGFGVVGIDGLKIEPLTDLDKPVEHYADRFGAPLDERVTSGFGGVSEYGITVRWDKSFLDVLHLNLARRRHFKVHGGIRFGGTITASEAFEDYGFDHVALASGAGKPTIIGLKNNLIRGVRKASDFLMALQLTGAFKKSSLANLQVRLPAVVIGGGLTAIDTATELAAYYPIQVEKLLARHEELGGDKVLAVLDPEERIAYLEMLDHARQLRAAPGKTSELIKQWGGVTIAYRKGLTDSPAYRLNHEEVMKCLEEGIHFAEGLTPIEAVPDEFGAVKAVKFLKRGGGEWEMPARTVCVAAGTSPNTTVEKEAPGQFEVDPAHHAFRSFTDAGAPAEVREDLTGEIGFFTSYSKGGKRISYFGDNHPVYAGSVVKAMASAKDGYPHIARLFEGKLAAADGSEQP